jgi:transcription antitermination factor NusG
LQHFLMMSKGTFYPALTRRTEASEQDADISVLRTWRAVRTRSRHEWKVRDQLLMKGFETFCPITYKWNEYRRRVKRTEWPLFPGYCFVRLAEQSVLSVLNCAGVTQIVSFAGHLASIPEHEIEGVRRLTATALEYDALPFVRIGAPVRVVRGPLAGTEGRLLSKGKHFRLLLAIELLGRMLSVEVSASDVQPR